ncbi:hypothetical protein ABID21_004302 [Pseudorhizobium tarimense]|uniref:Uncharacterized protein n=1 Tax=Pseudorhizobium tarimense TaxID=1079109 RepID=A0ABV2HCE0_9HYPH
MWEKSTFLVVGALLGWFLQQYRVARSEDAALINEHIKDIEKFCDAAQAYWLKVPASQDEERAAAAKVRAAHAATTHLYSEMDSLCSAEASKYREMSLELFNLATGGAFESSRTSIDAERAIDIYDLTAQIVHLLRRARRDVLSLGRLFHRAIDVGA